MEPIFILEKNEVSLKLIGMEVTINCFRSHKSNVVRDYFRRVLYQDVLPKVLYQRIAEENLSLLVGVSVENFVKGLCLFLEIRDIYSLCSTWHDEANHLEHVFTGE